jgi:hypothetical protein
MSALFVLALVLLVVSSVVSSDWWEAVLIELGAAALLVVPILFVERHLTTVEERQVATATDVARLEAHASESHQKTPEEAAYDLSEAVVSRLAAERTADEELFRAVAHEPSRDVVHDALVRAAELRLVSDRGPRVSLFDTPLYVRFLGGATAESDAGLALELERRDGTPIETIGWLPSASTEDVLVALGEAVTAVDEYPGDIAFNPGKIFLDLAALLELAHRAATGTGNLRRPFDPLIELCEPQWVITERGIVTTDPWFRYEITADRFDEVDWDAHVRAKGWVDVTSFQEAIDTARALAARGRLITEPRYPPPEFSG